MLRVLRGQGVARRSLGPQSHNFNFLVIFGLCGENVSADSSGFLDLLARGEGARCPSPSTYSRSQSSSSFFAPSGLKFNLLDHSPSPE